MIKELKWYLVSLLLGLVFPALPSSSNAPTDLLGSIYYGIHQAHTNPVLAQVAFAQAVLESGLLNTPSQLAWQFKNLFGIKSTRGKSVKILTRECTVAKCTTTVASFATFESHKEAIEKHKNLLDAPRYEKVREAETLETAAKELQKAGYATDPKYAKRLIKAYREGIKRIYGGS
jgi:flagellum-specific peptidoglycan hydrolase FlgJ